MRVYAIYDYAAAFFCLSAKRLSIRFFDWFQYWFCHSYGCFTQEVSMKKCEQFQPMEHIFLDVERIEANKLKVTLSSIGNGI